MLASERVTGNLPQERFLVYFRDFLKPIRANEIAFLYFEEKETRIVTYDKNCYTVHKPLSYLETKLDKNYFFKINRNFIVSYESIRRIEPYFGNRLVVFVGSDASTKAIVSREKVAEFKNWLGE